MWWWLLIAAFFLVVILALFLPEVIRREQWERRIPRRRRRKMQDRVDTELLSRTKNPAAFASIWRYKLGLWPFGFRRRLGGRLKSARGPYPGDPSDVYLPEEEPPPGT